MMEYPPNTVRPPQFLLTQDSDVMKGDLWAGDLKTAEAKQEAYHTLHNRRLSIYRRVDGPVPDDYPKLFAQNSHARNSLADMLKDETDRSDAEWRSAISALLKRLGGLP